MEKKYIDKEKLKELLSLIKERKYEEFLIFYFFYEKVVPNFFLILKKISKSDKKHILNYLLEIYEPKNERLKYVLNNNNFYEKLGIDLKKIILLKKQVMEKG